MVIRDFVNAKASIAIGKFYSNFAKVFVNHDESLALDFMIVAMRIWD